MGCDVDFRKLDGNFAKGVDQISEALHVSGSVSDTCPSSFTEIAVLPARLPASHRYLTGRILPKSRC